MMASQRFLRVNDVDLHVSSVVTVLVLGASAQHVLGPNANGVAMPR